MESELNAKLIDRTTSSFQLTEAGGIVLEDFQKILTDYENLLDKLSRLEEKAEGELHLGVLYYDVNSYVAKIWEVFRQRYPGIKLILHLYQSLRLSVYGLKTPSFQGSNPCSPAWEHPDGCSFFVL